MLCSVPSEAKKPPRETVTVILKESQTTPYDWYVNGRVSISCYGDTCRGYYAPPTSGTQQIRGAVLRLLRSDSRVFIARCVGKVNVFASIVTAVDAAAYNDPDSPTVYRDCRMPEPNTIVDAEFQGDSVKIFWVDDTKRTSETYDIIGILKPSIAAPPASPQVGASSPGPSTAVAADLRPYRFPEDGFAILCPSEPKPMLGSERFKLRSCSVPGSQTVLYAGVGHYDDAGLKAGPDAILEWNKNAALSRSGSRLVQERQSPLGVYPGIAFDSENDRGHFSIRIYLVGDTLYQIVAFVPLGNVYDHTEGYLDSFQLIAKDSN